jgi:hypothetical protein
MLQGYDIMPCDSNDILRTSYYTVLCRDVVEASTWLTTVLRYGSAIGRAKTQFVIYQFMNTTIRLLHPAMHDSSNLSLTVMGRPQR